MSGQHVPRIVSTRTSWEALAFDHDHNGLEVLSPKECYRLLGAGVVGRIAFTLGALPTVLPVNYLLDGDRILVRTSLGSKLFAAWVGAVVAFEVDDFDAAARTGWSVVVTGVASEVNDPVDLAHVARLTIPRWAPRPDGRVIAISTELISGRRIPLGAPVG